MWDVKFSVAFNLRFLILAISCNCVTEA